MKFVPYDKTAEVLQPCKQSFNLPATAIAPQGATVLCFASLSPIWSNHFNVPVLFQLGVEFIAVVGFVSNEPFGKLVGKTSVQGRFNQSHFVRRRTGHLYGVRNPRTLTDLPCPIAPLGGSGRNGTSRSHCAFVMSIPFSCRKMGQKSIDFLEIAHC